MEDPSSSNPSSPQTTAVHHGPTVGKVGEGVVSTSEVSKSDNLASLPSSLDEDLTHLLSCLDHVLFGLGDVPIPKQRKRKQSSSSSSSTATCDSSTISHFAPPGLEKEFHELYSILYPCLVERGDNQKANAAAILMGRRGSGKTILLERCLQCLQEKVREQQQQQQAASKNESNNNNDKSMFRIVTLNGLMVRGDNVGFCVKEIVQQLSDIAERQNYRQYHQQEQEQHDPDDTTDATISNDESVRRRPTLEKWLRLRKNFSFTSNLSLLDETFRLACVDQTPILIVLEELDTFVVGSASSDILSGAGVKEGIGKSERPVLLYHLLDRIATQGTLVSLVGMTSSLTALQSLEKRVKSRADGTTKIIHVQPQTASYETIVYILMSKLDDDYFDGGIVDGEKSNGINSKSTVMEDLRQQLTSIISGSTAAIPQITDTDNNAIDSSQNLLIQQIMERQHRLGKDIRWFCRVLYVAFALYREDCHRAWKNSKTNQLAPPRLHARHFMQALATMGASIPASADRTAVAAATSSSSMLVHGDARLLTLLDLSQPQVALLLAARRILFRDALQEEQFVKPLNLERMLQEYESFRSSTQGFSRPLLMHAFKGMLETSVLCPSADHTGGGPLQYLHQAQLYSNMDMNTLCRLPLHLPFEIERELKVALNDNLLDCSTALREWGRNSN
jgi:Cdc6-like AAA superfamily ATPase